MKKGKKITLSVDCMGGDNSIEDIIGGVQQFCSENTNDNVQVPKNLVSKNKKNYVLEINGDSMLKKGIVDGDKAIIEYCNDADNGDIVVALINDNEVTLKKLKKEKDKIYLIPENDNYKIQSFSSDEVKIQGKLKGIIRSY